jgi:hypothetical protein
MRPNLPQFATKRASVKKPESHTTSDVARDSDEVRLECEASALPLSYAPGSRILERITGSPPSWWQAPFLSWCLLAPFVDPGEPAEALDVPRVAAHSASVDP